MVYKIIWTENAFNDLEKIVLYLEKEWSTRIAEGFAIGCLKKIDLIAQFPFVGTQSEKFESVRRILITKHNSLYYRVTENEITLLNFFDTRQNPDKNIYETQV